MALSGLLEGLSLAAVLVSAASSLLVFLLCRIFFHPLSHIPGPWICRVTSLWMYYHSYIGDECSRIDELHRRYGPVIRIAPNEVCISDGAALAPIYSEKGGFLKAPCYTNFDIEGHATIFSTLDPAHRSVRSKAVLPLFGMSAVRSGNQAMEECVKSFIARVKEEASASRRTKRETGEAKPVNFLNLSRSLALDAVSTYLFGRTYGGVTEMEDKMSASSFVDALVAIGRFVFLPNWAFLVLDAAGQYLSPDKAAEESGQAVGDFVQSVVRESDKEDLTYQGRLLKAGISVHETETQCKDIIFAGTDTTGMNLSTICWHLAKQPDIYANLRREVADADSADPWYNPQSLRYLDAVIREGLRMSRANPTRLPRVVPPGGWTFTADDKSAYHIPAGTLVGVQLLSLHFDPAVFSDPLSFNPSRWLDSPTAEMQRDLVPFGLGQRQCIARNFALYDLFLAVRAIAREGVLEGASAVGERVEIYEWFNSRVKGERIELVWD